MQTRLVVAPRIEDELPQQRAVGAHDPDVVVSDQQPDLSAGIGPADADVAQAAQVADGEAKRPGGMTRWHATAPAQC